MATADQYANWIVQNKSKKGTKEFETVAAAYKLAREEEAQVSAGTPSEAAVAAIKPATAARAAPVGIETPAPRRGPSLGDIGDRATGFRAQVAETGMTPQERQEAVRTGAAFAGGIALGPVLGGIVRGVGAAIPAFQRAAPTVATSLESGGFRTGLPSTAGRAQQLTARAGGGAVTGGGAAALMEPEDTGTGAAVGAGISTLAPPVVKAVAKGGGYIADALQGKLVDVRANALIRQTIGDEVNALRELMRAQPDAPASRIAAQMDLPVLQALLREAEQLNPTGAANAFRKAEAEEVINELARIAGGRTSQAARTAQVEAKKALNVKTTPMREKALAEASPVPVSPLTSAIDDMLATPSVRNDDLAKRALLRLKEKIANVTDDTGVISPADLYEIRKSGINNAITELNPGIDAKSKNNYVSSLLGGLRDSLDKSMERAGGEGFKKYLQTFEAGMIDIEDARLANRIRSLYEKGNKASQERVVALLRGESPEAVQRILKSKRYEIDKILVEDQALLKSIEKNLGLDLKAGKEAVEGAAKLARIREQESVRVRFPFFTRISSAFNEAVRALEVKISNKTMDEIINAAQSGREFDRVLDSLSSGDRNFFLKHFKNAETWNNFSGQVAQASQAQVVTEPRNKLAPPSENQLRP
jgi:hypothetical protein